MLALQLCPPRGPTAHPWATASAGDAGHDTWTGVSNSPPGAKGASTPFGRLFPTDWLRAQPSPGAFYDSPAVTSLEGCTLRPAEGRTPQISSRSPRGAGAFLPPSLTGQGRAQTGGGSRTTASAGTQRAPSGHPLPGTPRRAGARAAPAISAAASPPSRPPRGCYRPVPALRRTPRFPGAAHACKSPFCVPFPLPPRPCAAARPAGRRRRLLPPLCSAGEPLCLRLTPRPAGAAPGEPPAPCAASRRTRSAVPGQPSAPSCAGVGSLALPSPAFSWLDAEKSLRERFALFKFKSFSLGRLPAAGARAGRRAEAAPSVSAAACSRPRAPAFELSVKSGRGGGTRSVGGNPAG